MSNEPPRVCGNWRGLPAQAHREREDYVLRSPVAPEETCRSPWRAYGMQPSAARGAFDSGEALATTRAHHRAKLCASLHAAVSEIRNKSEIELVLSSAAPPAAHAVVGASTRVFVRDGIHLNAAAAYEFSPDLKVSAAMDTSPAAWIFAKGAERVDSTNRRR